MSLPREAACHSPKRGTRHSDQAMVEEPRMESTFPGPGSFALSSEHHGRPGASESSRLAQGLSSDELMGEEWGHRVHRVPPALSHLSRARG